MRLPCGDERCRPLRFNSRTLGRVRQIAIEVEGGVWTFQFTHPGKGATTSFCAFSIRGARFQFTHPGKGATTALWRTLLNCLCFNSRTLGRVRHPCGLEIGSSGSFQFTHPGKGATTQHTSATYQLSTFQFTHPGKGATPVISLTSRNRTRFNSRTLGRVRPMSGIIPYI